MTISRASAGVVARPAAHPADARQRAALRMRPARPLSRPLHRSALLFLLALGLATGQAAADSQILHEQIPPDPRDDLALSVSLDGDLPAAIDTPSGIVAAPDPRRPVTSTERSTDARRRRSWRPL